MLLNDVTLREGDQMPGRDYTAEQKIDAVRALDNLGLPFIQPVFPATGEKDQSVVKALAGDTNASIIGLARALEQDVDAAVDAGVDVVEIFAPVSDLQLEHLLGKSREEMLSMVAETVDYISERGAIPHVTLADAFRTDPEHVTEVFKRVPDAEFVNLADTVGARAPTSVQARLDAIEGQVNFDRAGVHFHDDMGCGTANTLAAYHAGVGKADVSIASLGERAGNSSLEEVLIACAVDNDDDLGVDASNLIPVCRDVLDTLGEEWGDRKAILGREIAQHESSIHTAAMLSNPSTLEPFDPTTFGGERRLIFGSATGSGGARRLLERAGVKADEETIERFLDVLAVNGPLDFEESIELAQQEFRS